MELAYPAAGHVNSQKSILCQPAMSCVSGHCYYNFTAEAYLQTQTDRLQNKLFTLSLLLVLSIARTHLYYWLVLSRWLVPLNCQQGQRLLPPGCPVT